MRPGTTDASERVLRDSGKYCKNIVLRISYFVFRISYFV